MQQAIIEIISRSAAETIELGRRIGAGMQGGEIIALIGELGTGKTHLVKGIVLGLEASDAGEVTSPTFVLVHEYLGCRGTKTIYHIDAYRIESAAELEALGFDEYCRPDSVVLVEWADKVLPVLKGYNFIQLRLEHVSKNSRKIAIYNPPDFLLAK